MIPQIELGAILGTRPPKFNLGSDPYEDGALPFDQTQVLLAILVAEAPKQVLEIGTFFGHTTKAMAEALPTATIHTVDLPGSYWFATDPETRMPKDDFHLISRRDVGRQFRGRPCASRIVQHFADTATWDFREAGAPGFFFIDGSHTFEYCKNDSQKCLELVRGRSVFIWHDVDEQHCGVIRALLEWRNLGRDIRRIAGTSLGYLVIN
jgi:hypothetical protein